MAVQEFLNGEGGAQLIIIILNIFERISLII